MGNTKAIFITDNLYSKNPIINWLYDILKHYDILIIHAFDGINNSDLKICDFVTIQDNNTLDDVILIGENKGCLIANIVSEKYGMPTFFINPTDFSGNNRKTYKKVFNTENIDTVTKDIEFYINNLQQTF